MPKKRQTSGPRRYFGQARQLWYLVPWHSLLFDPVLHPCLQNHRETIRVLDALNVTFSSEERSQFVLAPNGSPSLNLDFLSPGPFHAGPGCSFAAAFQGNFDAKTKKRVPD